MEALVGLAVLAGALGLAVLVEHEMRRRPPSACGYVCVPVPVPALLCLVRRV